MELDSPLRALNVAWAGEPRAGDPLEGATEAVLAVVGVFLLGRGWTAGGAAALVREAAAPAAMLWLDWPRDAAVRGVAAELVELYGGRERMRSDMLKHRLAQTFADRMATAAAARPSGAREFIEGCPALRGLCAFVAPDAPHARAALLTGDGRLVVAERGAPRLEVDARGERWRVSVDPPAPERVECAFTLAPRAAGAALAVIKVYNTLWG